MCVLAMTLQIEADRGIPPFHEKLSPPMLMLIMMMIWIYKGLVVECLSGTKVIISDYVEMSRNAYMKGSEIYSSHFGLK